MLCIIPAFNNAYSSIRNMAEDRVDSSGMLRRPGSDQSFAHVFRKLTAEPVGRIPDGPWKRHPNEISLISTATDFPVDMSKKDYRLHRENREKEIRKEPKSVRVAKFQKSGKIIGIITAPDPLDMGASLLKDANYDEIAEAVERHFVNIPMYDRLVSKALHNMSYAKLRKQVSATWSGTSC
jgi:hypothetical protein